MQATKLKAELRFEHLSPNIETDDFTSSSQRGPSFLETSDPCSRCDALPLEKSSSTSPTLKFQLRQEED